MKKFLYFTLLITACNSKDQKLDGAYILVAAKYEDSTPSKNNSENNKTIRVFKNGYWINIRIESIQTGLRVPLRLLKDLSRQTA